MKKYTITFDVPDNFNPDNMSLVAEYPDGEVSISDERFGNLPLPGSLKDVVRECINIHKLEVGREDIVRFTFPSDLVEKCGGDPQKAAFIINEVKEVLEDITGARVMGHIDDIDVLVESPDEAIKMFEGMIAKIKVRQGTDSAKGIILP